MFIGTFYVSCSFSINFRSLLSHSLTLSLSLTNSLNSSFHFSLLNLRIGNFYTDTQTTTRKSCMISTRPALHSVHDIIAAGGDYIVEEIHKLAVMITHACQEFLKLRG